MPSPGFESLGEFVAGGDPSRREAAFLGGLDTGTKIKARQATTANALAQARLRVDEQENREGLADAVESLGLPREAAVSLRAGVDLQDVTKGLLDIQQGGFRNTIADTAVPFDQRQASAQAVEGKVVDPFQFGPGGDLFADVFNPGDTPQLSATGPASIAADEASAQQRIAAAKLSDERRLNPERFKSSTTVNVNGQPLSEQILGDTEAVSVIPENFAAEEAFGAESFLKGGTNALLDFVGIGTPFEKEAQARTVLGELSARTQVVLRADVPGGRIPLVVQELLARYAEDPTQLFRGTELARQNLTSTVTSLKRSLQRIKDQLDSPTKKTPTRLGVLESGLFAMTDLITDYEKVLESIERTNGPVGGPAEAAPDATSDAQTFTTPAGGTFTVPQ